MTRDSGVTYEAVRRACCAILAQGEQPTRPSVQAMLAQDDFLGHKGSNAIVQGFVSRFRREMAGILSQPERTVPGVPDDYVALQDKMLAEMVAVTRRIVAGEFEAREAELARCQEETRDAVAQARQAAQDADALRLRAEGERDGLQAVVQDWKANTQSLAEELLTAKDQTRSHEETINRQSQDLAGLRSVLDESRRTLEEQKAAAQAAEARHREALDRLGLLADQERGRLLQEIDDTKQAAKREAKVLQDKNARLRTAVEALQGELGDARASIAAAAVRIEALDASQAELAAENLRLFKAAEELERERITLQVRLETTEHLRREAIARVAGMEAEVAEAKAERKFALANAQAAVRRKDESATDPSPAPDRDPSATPRDEGP